MAGSLELLIIIRLELELLIVNKVLFVATVVKTHIMEFHIPYLKMFKEMGWQTAVAARNDYENHTNCVIPYCDAYYDIPFERNPLKFGNLKAYRELKRVIKEGNYKIIHCHTPVGAMLTRLAASDARKKGSKVFYTAHGFHFYKGAPAINWLAYYPMEKWLAKKTDVLITINKEDYERAKKKFRAGRIEYVPGVGIDIKKFSRVPYDRKSKRAELGLKDSDFILLSVGELIERKNHTVVLKALAELKKLRKLENIQYLICGRGNLADRLQKQADDLGVSNHVHFLGYRNDISAICNCSDAFVFMSRQEGLPVALMEAMACGLPVICSKIRGNTDLIRNRENGLFADDDPVAIADAIAVYLSDWELRERCAEQAVSDIQKFDLSSVQINMRNIYSSELEELPGGVKPESLLRLYHRQKLRKSLGIPLEAPVLLSVGEVNTNKNHSIVIKALTFFPCARYVVCGRGPLIDEHMTLAESLGIADRVNFLGYRTDIADFYGMADIFVFPSLREGLPVALMEAMASELICVASRNRGSDDLLAGSELLFCPTDKEELKEKLSRAITEDCKAEVIRYKKRLAEYDLSNTLDMMKKIYTSCIS